MSVRCVSATAEGPSEMPGNPGSRPPPPDEPDEPDEADEDRASGDHEESDEETGPERT